MRAERLAVGLTAAGLLLWTACKNDTVAPPVRLSSAWTGTTNPTDHASSATNWTMSVGPTGDGSKFEAVGQCSTDPNGAIVGTYRLLGDFDGYFMNLSGKTVGINLILQGTVSGDSLTGTYTGTNNTPCFVYSGAFQGSDK